MLSLASDTARRLRLPGYIVVTYMTIGSLLDILISTQPMAIHDIRWRLGMATLFTGASGTELLGAALFLGIALLASDEVSLWVGFALSLLVGLLYLGASGGFLLDAFQMRGQIKPDMLARYNLGLTWTVIRLVFTTVTLFVFSGSFLRAARAVRRAVDRSGARTASPLVVGTPVTPGITAPASRPNIERPRAPTA